MHALCQLWGSRRIAWNRRKKKDKGSGNNKLRDVVDLVKINACTFNSLTHRGYLIGEINIQRVNLINDPSLKRGNNVVVREKGWARNYVEKFHFLPCSNFSVRVVTLVMKTKSGSVYLLSGQLYANGIIKIFNSLYLSNYPLPHSLLIVVEYKYILSIQNFS